MQRAGGATASPIRRAHAIAATALALLLPASGCGSDGSGTGAESDPPTAFGSALATIGGGGESVGAGYGWVDLGAVDTPGERRWASEALGAGVDDLLREPGRTRSAGIDLTGATRIVSIVGSYPFGIRADGADGTELAAKLREEGAKPASAGNLTGYDLGEQFSRPDRPDLEILAAQAARTAIGDGELVLARSDTARMDLLGEGEPVTSSPILAAAVRCLGDVDAARVQPNNFTYLPNIGPKLLAAGAALEADGKVREVFCAVDPSGETTTRAAAAMSAALRPATDVRLDDRPPRSLAAASEVTDTAAYGLPAARAEIEVRRGAEPGIFLRAIATGRILTFEGLEPLVFG